MTEEIKQSMIKQFEEDLAYLKRCSLEELSDYEVEGGSGIYEIHFDHTVHSFVDTTASPSSDP